MVLALAVGPGAAHALMSPGMDQGGAQTHDHAVHCPDATAEKSTSKAVDSKGCCDCGMACSAIVAGGPQALAEVPALTLRRPMAGSRGLTGGTASPPFRPPRA